MNRTLDTVTYVRMFDPDPEHDFVVRRTRAIKELRSRLLKRRRTPDLITIVNDVCSVFHSPSVISGSIRQQIADAIKKNDDSFVEEDRGFELGLCAIAAINEAIASGKETENWEGWGVSDVLAACVWSALGYLPGCNGRKLEALRKWTITNARDRLHSTGSAARQRYQVTPAKKFRGMPINRNTYTSAVRAITALQINATIDSEEIHLLRWLMEAKSEIHGAEIASLSQENRAVTVGVELGRLTEIPPSSSHREHLISWLGPGEPLSLTDLLRKLGEARMRIAGSFVEGSLFKRAAGVFPLLSGISCGAATTPGDDICRPLSEWAARALLEHVLFRVRL